MTWFENWQNYIWVSKYLISIFLTVHILLKKSDHRSSLLWMALVWAMPIFGGLFYILFGVNRISTRAAKLNYQSSKTIPKLEAGENSSDHWQSFNRLGKAVSGSPLLFGHVEEIISGNEIIHERLLESISQAHDSIFLSTYIFRKDKLGLELADQLIAARKRGVEVKILLDGFGNFFYRSGIYKYLKKGGINTKRFLHSIWPWGMPYLNLRNHRKILLIDGKIGFTGSCNIGEVSNIETQFKLSGEIVEALAEIFANDWNMITRENIPRMQTKHIQAMDKAPNMRLISSGPNQKQEKIRWTILGAMGAAQSHIRIVTPYFAPDRGLISGLILAALRGINIEIILPSRSNYPFIDWASSRQFKPLLAVGVKIFRRDGVFDHSKMMTVDKKWALIGSSNWDAHSIRLNFELDIECHDPNFTHQIDQLIDMRRNSSQLVIKDDYDDRNVFYKIRDSFARLFLPYL
ncbi:MAG: hypothetical protein HKN36_07385 [Hellea sp.]|nr:hypothetical protein [Hellea sp.]